MEPISFTVSNIYPIILPCKYFRDVFGKHNSYYDNNPSMYIKPNGDVIVLVRRVDYRRFADKSFINYSSCSNSIFSIMTGTIKKDELLDLSNFEHKYIDYSYAPLKTYGTYWRGLEDIRFINEHELLVIVPECNVNGNPSILHAKLNNNVINNFVHCMPNIIEKNWMPYKDINNNDMVIYSLKPFIIKTILTDQQTTIDMPEHITNMLIHYHGSTNGIDIDAELSIIYNNDNKNSNSNSKYRLFLIHIYEERYCNRWMLFDIVNNKIELSEKFVFFGYSYIEFPISLCIYNSRIFVSLGVNDEKSFIVETNLKDILKIFTHLDI